MSVSQPQLDVLTVGHPLVDVIAKTTEEWLRAEGLVKGARRMITAGEAVELYGRMGPAQETSGGCAASTATGAVACGVTAAFAGAVGDDQLGEIFTHDIQAAGVVSHMKKVDDATGRCLILVTPDGDRTMNTCLASGLQTDLEMVAATPGTTAKLTYTEAYMLDNGFPWSGWVEAANRLHAAGGQFALSLSDEHCVARHRDELMQLLAGSVDVCIGNEHEARALFQTDDLDACVAQLAELCDVVAITLGGAGAIVAGPGETVRHEAEKVDVVDTTGAGDLYSSGFLAGLALGYDLERAGRLAIRTAAEAVSRIGARLPVGLKVSVS